MNNKNEPKNPEVEAKRISFLMKIYIPLYVLALVVLIIGAALDKNIVLIVIAVFLAAQAVTLDVYSKIARTKLNAKLNEESRQAGADFKKLKKASKRMNK